MKYLLDNCISYKFAEMLRAIEVDITALRESFSQSISDVDFYNSLHGLDVTVVSLDTKQQNRAEESRAIKQSGVSAIWLGPFFTKKVFWDQALWLVRRWPIIDGYISGAVSGTCADIKENGKAEAFTL